MKKTPNKPMPMPKLKHKLPLKTLKNCKQFQTCLKLQLNNKKKLPMTHKKI